MRKLSRKIKNDDRQTPAGNIVYKTFGNQWVIEHLSPYQRHLQLDWKVLRNAKRFIYVTVMRHAMTTSFHRQNE